MVLKSNFILIPESSKPLHDPVCRYFFDQQFYPFGFEGSKNPYDDG